LLLILIFLVPPGVAAVTEGVRRYPKRFAEVVPHGLYRGGLPNARHIRNLAGDQKIRTVVAFVHFEDRPKYNEERKAVNDAGLKLITIPMKGNGCGTFEQLDAAASALGDKANWPIFFHCEAGKQRSNAALAAYRLKACGWSIDQVLRELEAEHGLDHEHEGVLVDHLRAYAAERAGGPAPVN
jgi:protein tyrosine/serine phosphatase